MSYSLVIHHIGMCVENGFHTITSLVNKFGFHLFGERQTKLCRQWVLKSGDAVLIIIERSKLFINQEFILRNYNCSQDEHWSIFCCNNKRQHCIDSVFNVALTVKDVDQCVARIRSEEAGKVLLFPVSITDCDGLVRYAIVRSCVGNIIYTLIDKSLYSGSFLPGFSIFSQNVDYGSDLITHFDHITYCTHRGTSQKILEWHADCLGMKRFLLNRDESLENGFSLQSKNVGLRLKAMEYWHCSEVGMVSDNIQNSFKIVIAESLPGEGSNQIDTFLEAHEGPGLQHIGIHTFNITAAVHKLMQHGVVFRKPPPAYYTQIGKQSDIELVGEDLLKLQELGILLDCEADGGDDFGQTNNSTVEQENRYLMQVFTYPLFDKETFFLEVLQRKGATGFGAGNITALWRSTQQDTK